MFTDRQLSGDNFRRQAGVQHNVDWYHPNGSKLEDNEWSSPVSQAFMLDIGDRAANGERYIILFNASRYDICFHLPEPSAGMAWSAIMDTSEENGVPERFGDVNGLIPVCCSLCMKLLKQVDEQIVFSSYKKPAKRSCAVIMTSEKALYANIILRKGVV